MVERTIPVTRNSRTGVTIIAGMTPTGRIILTNRPICLEFIHVVMVTNKTVIKIGTLYAAQSVAATSRG
jgi:hypothetical protein